MNQPKFRTSLLLALCLSSLLVSSCKKEKTDDLFAEYAKADPIIAGVESEMESHEPAIEEDKINEDGITELSESDSLSDSQTAFVKNVDEKYQYKLKLEKGKTYPLHTKSTNTATQTFRGKSASETTTSYEDVDFKVLQAQNGFYKMSATFVHSKMVISGGGQSLTIDANGAKPKDKMHLGGWMIQKARKGKTVTFQMDENGTVSNVKGFEKIHADIKSQLQTEVKGEELTQLMQVVKSQLNGETFKMQVEQGMVKFPKGGVKIGETWTEGNAQKGGTTKFTLTKIENGKAHVKISSSIPNKSDKRTEQGITATISASMSSNGNVILDLSSGWMDSGKITETMTQKESMTDGKQTQSTSINVKNVTTINQ